MAGRRGHPLSPGTAGGRAAFLFGLALALASAATVDKYLGLAATALYAAAVTAATTVALPRLDAVRVRLSERTAAWLALVTLLGLAVLFALVYPRADSGTAGSGSDRDDAADLAADLLLHGDYPYAGLTYLGNPVSQLPGGVLLAVPFVAVWASALATFVWLPLLFGMLRRLAEEVRTPLLLAWVALALSPVLVREVVTGGDLIANTAAVMLAAWLVLEALARRRLGLAAAAAAALGVVLSWRLNFVFVLPPLLAAAAVGHGRRAVAAVAAATAAGFAAVTLPFYVGHRDEFTPLDASDKLEGFDGAIPGGARTVLLAGLVLGVALALRLRSTGIRGVFAQAAVVQAFFVLAVVALWSARAGGVELEPLVPGYGLPVALLALGAVASPVLWRARGAPGS